MRLFVAIQLNEKVKHSLLSIQEKLRRLGVRGNYTPPENLHLTLAFIGDYPKPDSVLEVLETLHFEPVDLRLGGMGSFGELWWMGMEESEGLSSLVRQLRHALAQAGIPFDKKKFLPHITLVRRPEYKHVPDFGGLSLPQTAMRAERVSLMLSTRGKNGMIYTQLGSVHAQTCRQDMGSRG